MRSIASNTMKTEIKIKNIPFANPDKVSIRPYLRAFRKLTRDES